MSDAEYIELAAARTAIAKFRQMPFAAGLRWTQMKAARDQILAEFEQALEEGVQ